MIDIIVNPVSGKGSGLIALKKIEQYLQAENVEYKVHELTKKGDGIEVTKHLCKEGASSIAAIGGDGTFHEVLNGMDFTNARLGLIPAGRGNDFAEGAHLSFDPITAIKTIIKGVPEDKDYIQVGQLRCLNVCGTGLDIEVLKLTEKSKNKLSYVGSLVKCLLNYKPYNVKVSIDGTEKTYSCIMVAFCNGTQFGGGIKLCPPALSNDGKMDLMIIKEPRCPTINVMPMFCSGHHLGKYWVEHVVCEKAVITALDSTCIELDGEIYEDNVMDAKIVKGGFKTYK